MSEEELEKALDEIFKEDIEMIRERMKVLMRGYDKALTKLVEKDKVVDLMAEHIYIEVVNEYNGEQLWKNADEVKHFFVKKVEEEN